MNQEFWYVTEMLTVRSTMASSKPMAQQATGKVCYGFEHLAKRAAKHKEQQIKRGLSV